MWIPGDSDTPAIEIARLIELAEFFERLPTVEVRGGIVRVGGQHFFKGDDRAIKITQFDVLHGEPIAGEGARRVLIEKLLKNFDAGRFQTVRIAFKRMACPFFRPMRPMEWSSGRAPLGAIFEGECDRGGTAEARFCNFGYARGLCAEFPGESSADAVRFSVSGSGDGIVKLVWILERDHAPIEHGFLEYAESRGTFVTELAGAMGVQARIFIENYLHR